MKLKVDYIPIEQLKPYEKNAKIHTQEQIEQIKKSIQEFGMNDPIGIWGKDNLIVEGHGRLTACKELGMKEVPVIRLDDLTDEQRKAYTLVHNQTTMNTGFDIDILNEELDNIELDMSGYGFDIEIDDIEENTEVKEDEAPKVKDGEPKAKRGEIYQLGRHRLMCGDSTSMKDVDELMDGNNAAMCFTDPPYGINYQSGWRQKTEKFEVLENDDTILDFMPCVQKYVDGFVFICTTWRVLGEWIPNFKKYFKMTNMIIWNKGGGGMGDLEKTFSTDYEIILAANQGEKIRGERIGSVWNINGDFASNYVHPTQKPVMLMSKAIEHTTQYGDNVLDLFGGSGSTLIACEQTNRNCYMMELDPHYVDVIIERWENFTGQNAKLLKVV